MEPPPEHVWSGIAAELALGAGPRPAAADRARRSRPRRGGMVVALAAAVALIAAAAVAIAGGFAGGPDDTGASRVVASASLTAYPGAPPGASGQVSVLDGVDGRRIEVTATMPPAPDRGYYEVWLLDARTNHMIAIGALAENGHGTYTMPTDLDMASYATVDVSAEQYDGDPAHSTSILRGDLTP